MSNDRKLADGDKASAPAENPSVDVDVKTTHQDVPRKSHPDHEKIKRSNAATSKVKEKVKERVKKIAEDAARKVAKDAASAPPGTPPPTRKDQYDAVKDAVDKEAEKIPRQHVRKVVVTVGDEHDSNTTEHEAKEGPPPSDSD